MNPLFQIDFSKFKIEVYTPEGQYIKDADINSRYSFYCQGLTPGQEYTVIFIYDDILILAAAFICNYKGKVIYLSPAHFLYNNEVSYLEPDPVSALSNRLKTLAVLNKPYQLWEKMLIENSGMLNHKHHVIKIPPKRVVKFKAGNELATKVK